MEKIFPKIIKNKFIYSFSVEQFGLYAITLVASCRSAKQTGQRGGEDLWVEIDRRKFREVPAQAKPRYQDISPSWNGSQLNGLKKTVIFLLLLDSGEHEIVFMLDNGATLEAEPQVKLIKNYRQINFSIEEQAEDGDRRPWFSFALIDLPLKNFSADITANYRFRDSDDVKLLVGGQIKKNNFSILHRDWLWSANMLTKFFKKERQKKTFEENLVEGIHYVDFWADRMPILHEVVFDLGVEKLKRIPSVENPKWTGENFKDDSEQMILARAIWGEARGASKSVRIAVAWSIRNRLGTLDKKGLIRDTYRKIILEPSQYSAFWELPGKDPNLIALRDPFGTTKNSADHDKWRETYFIAGQIILGEISDPTNGANHYFDDSRKENPPFWATESAFVKKVDNINFYRL